MCSKMIFNTRSVVRFRDNSSAILPSFPTKLTALPIFRGMSNELWCHKCGCCTVRCIAGTMMTKSVCHTRTPATIKGGNAMHCWYQHYSARWTVRTQQIASCPGAVIPQIYGGNKGCQMPSVSRPMFMVTQHINHMSINMFNGMTLLKDISSEKYVYFDITEQYHLVCGRDILALNVLMDSNVITHLQAYNY